MTMVRILHISFKYQIWGQLLILYSPINMKENKTSRSKRSLMVINLIQTPAGYSIIEGTQLLNKPQNSGQPPPSVQPPQVVHQSLPQSQQQQTSILKQAPKMSTKQTSLLFLKSPCTLNVNQKLSEKLAIIDKNKQIKAYADWFDLNKVSVVEKQQISNWFHQWKSEKLNDENFWNQIFTKYKSQRNAIIQIFYSNYAPTNSYMSGSAIRKYICDDAKWLMKVHMFLTSWGLINSKNINIDNQNINISHLFRKTEEGLSDIFKFSSAYYSQENTSNKKNAENEHYETLKKITGTIRPYCDFCGIHCQIVWFQHLRMMDPKQISSIMKNVNSKNPPLSQKEYEIILCTKCYCNGNFPLLLTHHDFRKVSVNDRLEPGRKKKVSKHKRKEKKRKTKEKQVLEQEEEYKEEVQEGEEEGSKKDKQKQKQLDREKEQDNDNENQGEKQQINDKDRKNSATPAAKQNKAPPQNEVKPIAPLVQPEKQVNINEIIQQIVGSVQKQRQWTFQQTKRLLQLIQKYGDEWDTILSVLKKENLCSDCEPEQIIFYFLRLPLKNVSTLIQQKTDESFMTENKSANKGEYFLRRAQRNIQNFQNLRQVIKRQNYKLEIKNEKKTWKQLLEKFVKLHITKINEKIQKLEILNIKALNEQRKYEEASKQISND